MTCACMCTFANALPGACSWCGWCGGCRARRRAVGACRRRGAIGGGLGARQHALTPQPPLYGLPARVPAGLLLRRRCRCCGRLCRLFLLPCRVAVNEASDKSGGGRAAWSRLTARCSAIGNRMFPIKSRETDLKRTRTFLKTPPLRTPLLTTTPQRKATPPTRNRTPPPLQVPLQPPPAS